MNKLGTILCVEGVPHARGPAASHPGRGRQQRLELRSPVEQYLATARRCAGDTPDDTTAAEVSPCPRLGHHHYTQLHVTLSDGHRQRPTPTATTHGHLYNSNKRYIGDASPRQVRHSRGVGWKSCVRVTKSMGRVLRKLKSDTL